MAEIGILRISYVILPVWISFLLRYLVISNKVIIIIVWQSQVTCSLRRHLMNMQNGQPSTLQYTTICVVSVISQHTITGVAWGPILPRQTRVWVMHICLLFLRNYVNCFICSFLVTFWVIPLLYPVAFSQSLNPISVNASPRFEFGWFFAQIFFTRSTLKT